MAQCFFCGAETILYVADEPVCGACDDKRGQRRKHESSGGEPGGGEISDAGAENSCADCAVLHANYKRLMTDLDSRIRGLRGVLGQSEYEERKRKVDNARRDAENARALLALHLSTHAMSAAN